MTPAADRIVFATDSVTIGAFRCAIDHPSFRDSGPIQQDCFVFPRTSVVIQHDRGAPFVADPTVVTLYNRAQAYERRPVSRQGDGCVTGTPLPPIFCARRWPGAIRRRRSKTVLCILRMR